MSKRSWCIYTTLQEVCNIDICIVLSISHLADIKLNILVFSFHHESRRKIEIKKFVFFFFTCMFFKLFLFGCNIYICNLKKKININLNTYERCPWRNSLQYNQPSLSQPHQKNTRYIRRESSSPSSSSLPSLVTSMILVTGLGSDDDDGDHEFTKLP